MFGDGLAMNPAVHRPINDGPWVKAVRERTHNDRIFVYHHRGTGKFVVAEWLPKAPLVYGQGEVRCTELFTISGPPDHFPSDLPSIEWVTNRCKPIQEMFKEWRTDRAKTRYDEAVAELENEEKRKEAARWMKKKGIADAAHSLGPGGAPYAGPSKTGKENMGYVEEELNRMASTRIISTGGKEKKSTHKS